MNAQMDLARFASAPSTSRLSPELTAAVKRCLLDTIAAALVGTSNELGEALLGYVRQAGAGTVPIIGSELRSTPDRAALANGTLGHALDFDDTVSSMPGHPGAVVFSALLSAIDGRIVHGEQFLAAMVIGYEVATKFGRALGMGHYNRGWHTTGTAGVFGATAAVAHLLELDIEQTSHAIGIAASMSSGLRVNFGTMTKPMHSGWAASSALTAAQLAAHGFTSSADALDGFFSTYGDERSDAKRLSLGMPYTMLEPGIGFKKYACCFAMHRAIYALEQLRADGVLGGPVEVVRVTARVAPGALKPLLYSNPVTGFEGKFSMEYALAVGIVDGDFTLGAFTDAAILRPEIRDALELTVALEDPECSPGDPYGASASAGTRGFVRVSVELADGRVASKKVTVSPGSPQQPMSDHDLREKFHACAEFAGLPVARSKSILGLIGGFEVIDDVGVLFELLAGKSASTLVDAESR